jgi:lysyl-tRNA synthetase class 2
VLAHPDRLAKVARMREAGVDPYPARGVQATPIAALQEQGGSSEEPGALIGERVTVAGRVLGLRDFGKLIFAPVTDRTGRLQVGLQKGWPSGGRSASSWTAATWWASPGSWASPRRAS